MRNSCLERVLLVTFSICLAIAGRGTSAREQQDSNARARRIHAETIGIDSHIDTLQRVRLSGNFLRVVRQAIGR